MHGIILLNNVGATLAVAQNSFDELNNQNESVAQNELVLSIEILESYGKKCFMFTDNFLRMSFPKEVNDGGQTGGQIGGQTNDINNSITERQAEVLKLIIENNRINRKQISDILGIAESAVQKHLKALTEANVIGRVGTNKGYWKILKKG